MPSPFTVAFVLGATPGKWARVWRERLPELPLNLVALNQEEAVDRLRAGSIDAALVRLPIDRYELSERPLSIIPLYTERAVVVAPRDHGFVELESLNSVALEGQNLLSEKWSTAVELVAANVGIAVMPQSVARALSRKDTIVRPLDDGPEWRIGVAWREGSTDPSVEEFIGIVRGRTARSSRGTAGAPSAIETASAPSRATAKKATRKPRARAQQHWAARSGKGKPTKR